MPKRALLLLNRHARRGKDDPAQLLCRLRECDFEVVEEASKDARDLSEVIRRHRDRVDLVIVGGGDGTLNAAADGLVDTQLPLGILPLGTANDLARTLGIPPDPAEACKTISGGRLKRIDLGWANGKHFFNVASMGLSVQITQQLDRRAKRRWGVLAYLLTAVRVLWNTRPFRAQIRANGACHDVRTVQIAVGNGCYYGGGMAVDEEARIDDQLLHLYSLEVKRWWQVLFLFPALMTGTLRKSIFARTLQGPEFEIVTRRSRPVNTDGEITTRSPCRFRLVPRAVSVFVPGEAGPAETGGS